MKVKEIMKKRKELWKKADKLNPSLAPQGSGLSWDGFYKACEEAKEFDEKEFAEKLNEEK